MLPRVCYQVQVVVMTAAVRVMMRRQMASLVIHLMVAKVFRGVSAQERAVHGVLETMTARIRRSMITTLLHQVHSQALMSMSTLI